MKFTGIIRPSNTYYNVTYKIGQYREQDVLFLASFLLVNGIFFFDDFAF